jgi:hypothetical protein
LAGDASLRAEIGEANRHHCVNLFSLAQMIDAYRQMYCEGAGSSLGMVGTPA